MAGADSLIDPKEGIHDLFQTGRQTEADRCTLFTYAAQLDPSHPQSYAWGDIRGHVGRSQGRLTNPDGAVYKVIGPEVGLARTLAQQGWRDVVIIKAAMNFRSAEMNRSPWVRPNSLWRAWMDFLHQRLTELAARGATPIVRGIVWDQGIDDGLLRRSRAAFEADVQQLLADLREEFGSEVTPAVLTRSVNSPIAGKNHMRPIRAAQVALAESTPNTAWVNTDDLGPFPRGHHLSANAQLRLGRRHAEALVRLTSEPICTQL